MTKHWSAPLPVNLLLGIPGVVPVRLLWYYLPNGPLATAGLTTREPTENDGVLGRLLIAAPVAALFGMLWWLANAPLRRRTALTPGTYRLLSVLAPLLPTAALFVNTRTGD
ncbi:hypothetical protein ABZ023_14020 [Streptomyces sp. NPDC006367]|uniref:hypothetical protein n=1 Tax=unclassified Streptomyces TaxID=2593676 RepID=UPI0033A37103